MDKNTKRFLIVSILIFGSFFIGFTIGARIAWKNAEFKYRIQGDLQENLILEISHIENAKPIIDDLATKLDSLVETMADYEYRIRKIVYYSKNGKRNSVRLVD